MIMTGGYVVSWLCCSKRLAEAEAMVTELRRCSSRSPHPSSSFSQVNGAAIATDDAVALDDQYTLGAAKKGLKKLRDQLDQDVTMKGKWAERWLSVNRLISGCVHLMLSDVIVLMKIEGTRRLQKVSLHYFTIAHAHRSMLISAPS